MPTALELAKRPSKVAYYRFVGSFGGATGAALDVATAYVKTTTGLVRGRLLRPEDVPSGVPETIGAAPQRVSCVLEFDNTDRSYGPWIVGTGSGQPSAEFLDDGFHNLSGQLKIGLIDTDGTIVEEAISPTLFVAGAVSIVDGTRIRVPMASRDDRILGPPVIDQITPRMIAEGSLVADGTIQWLNGTTESFDTTALDEWRGLITEGRAIDAQVPWAVGRTTIPLVELASTDTRINGLLFWKKGGVGTSAPTISDYASWLWFGGRYEEQLTGIRKSGSYLWRAEIEVTLEDGTTQRVWICGARLAGYKRRLHLDWLPGTDMDYEAEPSIPADVPIIALPPKTNILSSPFTGPQSPSQVMRAIVAELSELGTTGIDSTSWDRATEIFRNGGVCGGCIRGNGTIAGWLGYVARPFGFALWIGSNDKLHVLVPGAWNEDDVTAAAGTLPHIREHAILGEFEEVIPLDHEARGGAVNKVFLKYSDAQHDFWPSYLLRRKAPGVTSLPLGQTVWTEVDASWVWVERSGSVLASIAERRNFLSRQFRFVAAAYLGFYSEGQLVLLTTRRGAGTGGADGYERRLARIVRRHRQTMQDRLTLELEDLGSVSTIKPAVYDTIDNWAEFDPAALGYKLIVGQGGSKDQCQVTDGAGVPVTVFGASAVGSLIDTPGASDAANRTIQRKITALVGGAPSSQVTVEYAYNSLETIVAGGPDLIDCNWLITKSQANKSPTNTTKLTACREAVGTFRDGATAGFQVTNG